MTARARAFIFGAAGRENVPLPTLLSLAFGTGVAASVAARAELRISPRPALLTRSFAAYFVFAVLVLVPVSAYFYVFHGDWFLLYMVDVRRVPSAIALVGFMLEVAVGAAGFVVGSNLVRSQREGAAVGLAALTVAAGVALAFLVVDRLAVVGSFAQYRGGFGLVPFGQSAVLHGAIAMGLALIAGLTILILRLYAGSRRGG